MNLIINYLKVLVIPLVFVFAFPLILAILNLFGVFSTKLITIIFFGIIALYSGYKLGRTVNKRGFIHGLALGVILSLFMFVFSLLFHNHYLFNTLIYYIIICLSSLIGASLGIQKSDNWVRYFYFRYLLRKRYSIWIVRLSCTAS